MNLKEIDYKVKTGMGFVGDVVHLVDFGKINQINTSINDLRSSAGLIYMWRQLVGISRNDLNRQSYPAVTFLYTLLKRYDEIIDTSMTSEICVSKEDLKREDISKKLLNRAISYILDSGVERDEAMSFLSRFNSFRRVEWDLFVQSKQQDVSKMSFGEVSEYKASTCGLNAEMAVDLIALYHPQISRDELEAAKKSFVSLMLAAQIYDDVQDVYEDYSDGVPNLLNAALNCFPEEQKKVIELRKSKGKIRGMDLLALAPKSFEKCNLEFQKYLDGITSLSVRYLVSEKYNSRYRTKEIKKGRNDHKNVKIAS